MPNFSSAVLPKPKDWNEFEDICLSASKSRWGNPNFSRFGRQGQKQNGVDIYGYDMLGRLVGVQCKNTLGVLTAKLIEFEISNAEGFSQALAELNIATTAPSDIKTQRHVMQLSRERVAKGKFGVAILFWPDIEQELSKSRGEVERFYPQFFNSNSDTGATISSPRDKDIDRIKELLGYIDIDSLVYWLEMAPKYVPLKFMEREDPVQRVISSPAFMLYDKELESRLYNWLHKWFEINNKIRFAPYNYIEHQDTLSFIMPMDFCRTLEGNNIYEELEEMCREFLSLQRIFCQFIHDAYPEIDLKSTSKQAREFYSAI